MSASVGTLGIFVWWPVLPSCRAVSVCTIVLTATAATAIVVVDVVAVVPVLGPRAALAPRARHWQDAMGFVDPATALERLRVTSTTTLAESVRSPALREKVVATTSPQLVFDTWKTSSSREIKYNCALTLAYMFLHKDVTDDEWLVPVLSLCCSITDTTIQAVCIQAVLNR